MPVAAMNHFTVLSDDLEATRRFYCDLFGFKVGWRPPFQFPGWWLYADDDTPILHVIHSKDLPHDRAAFSTTWRSPPRTCPPPSRP